MKTRDKLLKAALHQFADRGFYGVSIANIADELGISKQALLHHFGSKEKLYGEILKNISEEFLERCNAIKARHENSESSLELMIVDNFHFGVEHPKEAQLLMRELLDNEHRTKEASVWYLKPYLDMLVDVLRKTKGQESKTETEALTLVYQLLGAVNYFHVSHPTLRKMFGVRKFNNLDSEFETTLRGLIRPQIKNQ